MEGVNLTRACHATGEFVRSIEKRDVLVSLALISVAGLLAAAVAGAARRFGLSGGGRPSLVQSLEVQRPRRLVLQQDAFVEMRVA